MEPWRVAEGRHNLIHSSLARAGLFILEVTMHVRIIISDEEKQEVAGIWGMSLNIRFRVLDMFKGPLYDYYVIWLPDYSTTVRCPKEWMRN